MSKIVKKVNERIEIREADKFDQERGLPFVLAFINSSGHANLSSALSVDDVQALRAALGDSRFLPPADSGVIRQGDTVHWRSDSSKVGRVGSVDIRNGEAFVEGLGWGDWYRIADLRIVVR